MDLTRDPVDKVTARDDGYPVDKIDFLDKDINDHKGTEENFLIDGKLVPGKLLKTLNERILKWATDKQVFTKMKGRMGRKYIPTLENDETILPKMFLRKYGIPEKSIHFVNCNFRYTQEKMGAADKHIQTNEYKTQKRKKGVRVH